MHSADFQPNVFADLIPMRQSHDDLHIDAEILADSKTVCLLSLAPLVFEIWLHL